MLADAADAIWGNLAGGFSFDWLIIGAGALNGAIYWRVLARTKKVSDRAENRQTAWLPGYAPPELSPKDVQELADLQARSESLHSVFVAITSVFALLGILGTVLAMLMLVGGDAADATQQGFYAALTSTFWGVLFAAAYRICDAIVSPKIQNNSIGVNRKIDGSMRARSPYSNSKPESGTGAGLPRPAEAPAAE